MALATDANSSVRTAAADHPQLRLYRMMARVREFESLCQRLWLARVGPGPRGEVERSQQMPGFVHLSIGQEAVSVGVCTMLRDDDHIASTHRGHGHVIAKGGDLNKLMAELYGRVTGYCRGKGGSMHVFAPEIGVLGTNGIVGGGIPHAVGAALSHKLLGRDSVAVSFFGDGESNQGVFFESMNLTALWALPVVFVCENNLYSEWTNYERLTAGARIVDRASPFGIPAVQVDGTDVLAVRDATAEAVRRARAGRGPSLIEARTYIQCGHMEGEEVFAGRYRSDEEITSWELRDPLITFALPGVMPGVLIGSILLFIFGMTEFLVSLIIATTANQTLPVVLFASLRGALKPRHAAAGGIYIWLALIVVFLMTRFRALEQFLYRRES